MLIKPCRGWQRNVWSRLVDLFRLDKTERLEDIIDVALVANW